MERAIGKRRRVFLVRDVDGKGEGPLGDEAQIDPQEVLQASHHQSAGDQEDDREGDLGGHEQSRDPEATAVHARPRPPGSQRGRDGEAGGDRGRSEGHDEGGDDRRREREGERAAVDANIREPGDAGRSEGRDRADGGHGERRSGEASREREEGGVEQLLKDDLRRAGAERAPDGQVGPPPDGLDQEKDGHVRAGEKQDAGAADGEGLQGLAGARAQVVIDEGHHRGGITGGGEPIREREPPGDAGQVGARGLRRHPFLQPPHDVQHTEAPEREGLEFVAPPLRVHGRPHRRPELRALGEVELPRHDADDREWAVAPGDSPADDARIAAEPSLPETVAQDEHALGRGLVLVGAGTRGRGAGAPAACRRRKRTRTPRTRASRAGRSLNSKPQFTEP